MPGPITGGSSGGGISTISDPEIAYIRSDGNDSTGTIGNAAKPYLTIQAAWDDGAEYFDIGNVNVGNWNIGVLSGDTKIWIRGRGFEESVIGTVTLNPTGVFNLVIYDVGAYSFGITSLVSNGVNGGNGATNENGSAGTPALDCSLYNVFVSSVSSMGGNGGNGGTASANGTDGGAGSVGASFFFFQCRVGGVSISAGNGGNSGTGTFADDGVGGNGGNGGNSNFYNFTRYEGATIEVKGGEPGSGGTIGGDGIGGDGGNVQVQLSYVGGNIDVSPGTNGSNNGFVLMEVGVVTGSITGGSDSGPGQINGTWQNS